MKFFGDFQDIFIIQWFQSTISGLSATALTTYLGGVQPFSTMGHSKIL